MRAVLLTGHGGLDKLQYREDIETPVPRRGEVLIAIGASAIANGDIWIREGAYGDSVEPASMTGWRRGAMSFPRIQGSNIVGRIVEVGPDVPAGRIGERIIVDFVLRTGAGLADAGLIGSERDGGFAEYVALPSENAHSIVSEFSDTELATFPTAYVTAERMLERAALRPGETIVVTGASGGVGCALVQLSRLRDARVIAVVSKGKQRRVRELGADEIVYRGNGDVREQVLDLLDGSKADVVADIVGGGLFPSMLDLVRAEGRYVVAGAIAGPVVSLDLRTVYLNHLDIIGSSIGTRDNFVRVKDCIEKGLLKPVLGGVFALRDIRAAQTEFKSKDFIGRIAVIPVDQ